MVTNKKNVPEQREKVKEKGRDSSKDFEQKNPDKVREGTRQRKGFEENRDFE